MRLLLASCVGLAACFTPVGEPVAAPMQPVQPAACKGTGRFTPSMDLPGLVASGASGDFNEDGHQDLALAVFDVGPRRTTLQLRFGDGTGTFGSPGIIEERQVDPSMARVVAADLDSDGHLDLIEVIQVDAPSPPEREGSVRVLRGDGTGGFRFVQELNVGYRPAEVRVGDFDADGRLDLAIAGGGLCFDFAAVPSSVRVLWGAGDATFSTGPVLSDDTEWGALTTGDIDGDEVDDLVVHRFHYDGGCLNAAPVETLEFLKVEQRRLVSQRSIELTSTYALPVVVPVPQRSPSVVLVGWGVDVLRALSPVGFGVVQQQDWRPQRIFGAVVSADFDGDGVRDVVGAQMVDPLVSFLATQADGTLSSGVDSPNGSAKGSSLLFAADFNGDGAMDLFASDNLYGTSAQVMLNECR